MGESAVGVQEKVKLIGGLTILVGITIILMGMQFGRYYGTWDITLGTWFLIIGLLVMFMGFVIVAAAPDFVGKS